MNPVGAFIRRLYHLAGPSEGGGYDPVEPCGPIPPAVLKTAAPTKTRATFHKTKNPCAGVPLGERLRTGIDYVVGFWDDEKTNPGWCVLTLERLLATKPKLATGFKG